jgi:hypothetical protein
MEYGHGLRRERVCSFRNHQMLVFSKEHGRFPRPEQSVLYKMVAPGIIAS